MEKIFFKTNEKYREYLKEFANISKEHGVQCACGQSVGAYVYDDDYYLIKEIILCEACYNNAPCFEQGE